MVANNVPTKEGKYMRETVTRLCRAARLIREENFEQALDQTKSAPEEIEKVSGVLNEKTAIELRTAFKELDKSLGATVHYVDDLAREEKECKEYQESTGRMYPGGTEYYAEMISVESLTSSRNDTRRCLNLFAEKSSTLCKDIYNLLVKACKEADGGFVPEEFPTKTSTAKTEEKIKRLHQELQRVYGDSLAGGPVLAELGDALCEAGRLEAALGKYEASLGHLKETGQGGLAQEVEKKIAELEARLAVR